MEEKEREKLIRLKNSSTYRALKNAKEKNLSLSSNGCLFKRQQGFLPEIMERMFADRTLYKKKMLDAKKELEAINNEFKRRGVKNV